MSDPIDPTIEHRPARLVWHPDTNTVTVEVQGDGHSVVIATIPADPLAE